MSIYHVCFNMMYWVGQKSPFGVFLLYLVDKPRRTYWPTQFFFLNTEFISHVYFCLPTISICLTTTTTIPIITFHTYLKPSKWWSSIFKN